MAAAGVTLTECYYDVLGVAMEATDSEIRKAYRKSALQWHPDKNQHRVQEATARMKQITEAYSVLSDASERSWYDAHRESILSGSGAGGDDGDSSMTPNLFPFFSASCFGEFDESEGGFYSVYSRAFDSIIRAERRHRPRDAGEARPMPSFGTSASPWEDVSSFYRSWTNYSSDMLFAWVDEHRTTDGANRITRRWMDKQNEKARHKAREAWTERVQMLAQYVRRRDPRIAKQAALVAAEKERRAAAAAERKAAEAKAMAERQAELAEAAAEYRESLEAASGFRLADEGGAEAAEGSHGSVGADAASSATSAGGQASEATAVVGVEATLAQSRHDAAVLAASPAAAASATSDVDVGASTSSVALGGAASGSAEAATRATDTAPLLVTLETTALSEDYRDIAKSLRNQFNSARERLALDSTTGKVVTDLAVIKDLRKQGAVPAAWSNGDVMYAVETGRPPSEKGKAQPGSAEDEEAQRPKAEFVLVTPGSGRTGKAGRGKKAAKSRVVACRVCAVEFPDFKALLAHIDESGHRAAPKTGEPAEPETAATSSATTTGDSKSSSGVGEAEKAAAVPGKSKGSKSSLTCGVCMETFASKSKLFKHIQTTGHALPKTDVAAATASTAVERDALAANRGSGKGKRKKGSRRKGQRGTTDSDDGF